MYSIYGNPYYSSISHDVLQKCETCGSIRVGPTSRTGTCGNCIDTQFKKYKTEKSIQVVLKLMEEDGK